MNEIEAKSKIKHRIAVVKEIAGTRFDRKIVEDLEIAIQALKEIREYRELGSVEEVKMLKDFKELYDAYNLIGTIEEFRKLKYQKNVLPIATIEFSKEDMQKIVDEKVAQIELDIQEIRNNAIDEFAERIKQGDVIEYMGSYVSYEAIVSFINEIAEQMKGGAE